MNRGELVDAITGTRFDASQPVSDWLDSAYSWVYFGGTPVDRGPQVRWSFRFPAEPVSLTVTAGNRQPTMPTDFGEVVSLLDDQGVEMDELTDAEFERAFRDQAIAGGAARPTTFKVVNRQIVLAPTPDSNYTFNLAYARRLYHFELDGTTIVVGPMTNDSDLPCFGAEHHLLLVYAATIIGLGLENDPFGAPAIRQLRDDAFAAMREDLQIDLGRVDDYYPPWP